MNSQLGLIEISGDENFIHRVQFVEEPQTVSSATAATKFCAQELNAYFNAELRQFESKLQAEGTDFQQKVWGELLKIPFGESISYTELAIRTGDVKNVRAVGLANGRNPIAILIPCHRVIGKHGELTGYAGGLNRKKLLLQHEGILAEQLEIF
ncbi:MAG TPA: methylated-DNA--[protein]-cysteine S-methyltransferase [Cyclobacteriaceae bacterium]|nr:methylated-DNA--[protein]-cysteine S-methyltransferase [Cyclobacteriaceae bacterium]